MRHVRADKIGNSRLETTPGVARCGTCAHHVGDFADGPCRACREIRPGEGWEPGRGARSAGEGAAP